MDGTHALPGLAERSHPRSSNKDASLPRFSLPHTDALGTVQHHSKLSSQKAFLTMLKRLGLGKHHWRLVSQTPEWRSLCVTCHSILTNVCLETLPRLSQIDTDMFSLKLLKSLLDSMQTLKCVCECGKGCNKTSVFDILGIRPGCIMMRPGCKCVYKGHWFIRIRSVENFLGETLNCFYCHWPWPHWPVEIHMIIITLRFRSQRTPFKEYKIMNAARERGRVCVFWASTSYQASSENSLKYCKEGS